MIKSGLTLEALCLLNGYLEVWYKIALQLSVNNKSDQELLKNFGHGKILDIVKRILAEPGLFNQYNNEQGQKYYIAADQIYRHRNDYLHDLTLPEKFAFMTNIERTKLNNLMQIFIEPSFYERQFDFHIQLFKDNEQVTKIVIRELEKVKRRDAKKSVWTYIKYIWRRLRRK